MKLLIVISLFVVVCAYTDIDDNYNYYSDVHNKVKLKALVDCLLERTACTDTMKHIQVHMQQIMMDGCAECDTIQKHYAHEFLTAAQASYPQDLALLDKKYDTDGKHLTLLQKAVADN